jgi:hypothetical protein
MSAAGEQDRPQGVPTVPDPDGLAAQTRALADQISQSVGQAYLDFRRQYFHEANPSLATVPPSSQELQQTETARIAQRSLRLIPREAHAVPLVRDLMDHLQWVVDIHTLTDSERMQLHNLTMVFLHGMTDGVQAWYVNWLVASEHALQYATHPKYYLAFPWQGLLYRKPHDLVTFDTAVRTGDIAGIEREIKRVATELMAVLRDPVGTQPRLAFAGPDGERRKIIFDLKTSAALALAAYLAVELLRTVLGGSHPEQLPQSVIGLPAEIEQHMLPPAAPGAGS